LQCGVRIWEVLFINQFWITQTIKITTMITNDSTENENKAFTDASTNDSKNLIKESITTDSDTMSNLNQIEDENDFVRSR
jgi:hypothetical protein